MRRRGILVCASSLLVACQAGFIVQPAGHPASPAPSVTGPVAGVVTAKASAVPVRLPPRTLQRPVAASLVLAGTVQIDAGYAVSQGQGTTLGAILAAGDAYQSAGGLVSRASGQLVANNSGNLISDTGSGLVSNNGGSIVSNNSSGVTAHAAGAAIGENGAGFAAGQRALFALPAATAAAATGVGLLLPAAGMELRAYSLRTHAPLSVGVDASGKAVYAIFTDLKGAFQVYVPASEAGNVLISTRVPATQDGRLIYPQVASTRVATVQPLDEDTVLTWRYARESFIGRLVDLFTTDPAITICKLETHSTLSPALQSVFGAFASEIHKDALNAGISSDPAQAAALWDLAGRCADIVLADVDLAPVMLSTTASNSWGDLPGEGPEPALADLTTIMRGVRETAAADLARSPTFFASKPYLVAANACAPDRFVIQKPADLGGFLVDEYLSRDFTENFHDTNIVLDDLQISTDSAGVSQERRLRAAVTALGQTMVQAFFTNQAGIKDRVLAQVAAYNPKLAPTPDGPAIAPLPSPCTAFPPYCLPGSADSGATATP